MFPQEICVPHLGGSSGQCHCSPNLALLRQGQLEAMTSNAKPDLKLPPEVHPQMLNGKTGTKAGMQLPGLALVFRHIDLTLRSTPIELITMADFHPRAG